MRIGFDQSGFIELQSVVFFINAVSGIKSSHFNCRIVGFIFNTTVQRRACPDIVAAVVVCKI